MSMLSSVLSGVLLALALMPAGQNARPATLVSEVRAATAEHDLAAAEALVSRRRAAQGDTSEVLAALSWVARGALAERQRDRADALAAETHRLSLRVLGSRSIDSDANLVTAVGAAIEVQAQIAADRGQRSEAIAFLERELATYRSTTLAMRIQKNINLLTLEGRPAPPLARSESIGTVAPPALTDLKGKVVVLFFWAHWCPDCKIVGPILAKLRERYQSKGLAIVAPTQRYGYVARGAAAPPDEELRYIVKIRDEFYPFLADLPVPLSVANHQRYGVSSTPTVVILDRQGMVRVYHPGRMTEPELDLQLRSLLDSH